jgi:hypothetical protein
MKLQTILETLTKHREHFRVLPDKANLELTGLMNQLDAAIDQENREKADVVAAGTEENPKVSKRPYRKRVGRSVS